MVQRFPHQSTGSAFLATRKHALLGDDPGLGKTLQVVDGLDKVGARTALIICPASVRPHWAREVTQHSRQPRRIQMIERTGALIDPEAEVVIVSYAGAIAPRIREQLLARNWDALILDEVQALKERQTRRARVIYGPRCDGVGGLIERAARVWGLSGTLCPNGWSVETYSHLRAFGVTDLTELGFAHRFNLLRATKYGKVPVANQRVDELAQLMRPVYLRRRIGDVAASLPPIRTSTQAIAADPRALLELEADPALAPIREALERGSEVEILSALQHASGEHVARLRRLTGLAKVPGALELLREELAANPAHKVVIFCWHREVVQKIADGLAEFGAVTLSGGSGPVSRQASIDRFSTDPSCRAFVAQIVAGGTGISLVAASHVVLVEPSWTIADNSQAIARCRRYGQTADRVLARFLVVPDSIDAVVNAVLARKAAAAAMLEGAAA